MSLDGEGGVFKWQDLRVQGSDKITKGWTQPDRVAEPLYVIVPIFNASRWKARWKHAIRAIKHFVESGAVVYVVEAAFGQREHALLEVCPNLNIASCPPIEDELRPNCRHDASTRGLHRYIPLRTDTEAWVKENLINIGIRYLPQDWKYVAWLDADVLFSRPNWVGETIHLLQHYEVLQMFSQAQDLDSKYAVIAQRPSFMWAYQEKIPLNIDPGYYYPEGYKPTALGAWSGLAWAARRSALNKLSGLPDFCIHGGGDYHMAFALIGQVDKSIRKDCHESYKSRLYQWQKWAVEDLRCNVGCMTGTLQHFWHGAKVNRHYSDRHRLLAETQFDPNVDIKYDTFGIIHLVDDHTQRYIALRDGLREYARARNEDQLSD